MSEDAVGSVGAAIVIAVGIIVYAMCISMGACNVSSGEAQRILSQEGVSNVQLGGYAWLECDKNDTFSVAFDGSKNGHVVHGAICAGWLKDYTVRYK